MSVELPLGSRVFIAHSADAAQNFREVERDDGNTVRLEQFLAIPDGIERRRAGADRTDTKLRMPRTT